MPGPAREHKGLAAAGDAPDESVPRAEAAGQLLLLAVQGTQDLLVVSVGHRSEELALHSADHDLGVDYRPGR